jgi:hypothetical protein
MSDHRQVTTLLTESAVAQFHAPMMLNGLWATGTIVAARGCHNLAPFNFVPLSDGPLGDCCDQ